MTPTISVIIPTYQRGELLRDAIASVEAQTYRDFELIVIDDGSTDGTGEILESLDTRGLRFHYRWRPNRGVAAARNVGLELARGEIIAFLDSDDLWLTDHLDVVVEVFRRQPEAVLVSTCPEFILAGRQQSADAALMDYRSAGLLGAGRVGFPSCIAVRAEAIRQAGGFDERLGAYRGQRPLPPASDARSVRHGPAPHRAGPGHLGIASPIAPPPRVAT